MPGTIIIGIGNPHRRDDAVGLHVARALRGRVPIDIGIHECRGEATELMSRWSGATKTVIVDAMDSGQTAGNIVRLDVSGNSMPASLQQTSTHGFGLAEAVELARTLGELPAELIVFGIQGADFQPGDTLSPPVRNAVPVCCQNILNEICQPRGQSG